MSKFRKKPVVIEAVCWTGSNHDEVAAFLRVAGAIIPKDGYADSPLAFITVPTLEGKMSAQVGDWIIKGVAGEFYPCKPAIFEATYEPVPSDS